MKSRKVLTILLSLAIMFTFMPAMAFASDTTVEAAASVASWGEKYATVTDTNGHTFDTERTFASSGTYEGLITADPQNDTSVQGITYTAPTSDAYFYDLDGSYFAYGNSSSNKALDGTTWTQSAFENMDLGFNIVEPSYTTTYEDATYVASKAAKVWKSVDWEVDSSGTAAVSSAALTNWTVYVTQSAYTTGLTTDQTVTFSVKKMAATKTVDPTIKSTCDLDGTIATATVTVKGEDKTPETAKVYLDSTDGLYSVTASDDDAKLVGRYDGAAHTVVCEEIPGYTVAYSVYDSSKGKYVATDAVSITDVQEDAISVKATFTNTKTKVETPEYFTVNLYPAKASIGFDEDQSVADADGYDYYFEVAGSEFDAMSFIAVTPDSISKSGTETAAAKAERLAFNTANAAAVTANKSEIMDFFKAVYNVKATVTKSNANIYKLEIEENNLTTAEEEALIEKYEQLIRNFRIDNNCVRTNEDAQLTINTGAVDDDEVTFTKAISSKTFKGSKTTKKGKLKKNQTIQFTAEAANGSTVKYKLINANTSKISIDSSTGKLTIKKGLTKGTYKFSVKAYVPGAYNYETQYVVIKVKK